MAVWKCDFADLLVLGVDLRVDLAVLGVELPVSEMWLSWEWYFAAKFGGEFRFDGEFGSCGSKSSYPVVNSGTVAVNLAVWEWIWSPKGGSGGSCTRLGSLARCQCTEVTCQSPPVL